MTARKKKTAWSWGAIQAAIVNHFSRNSATYSTTLAIAGFVGLTTCTGMPAHATMTPALKGAGAEHTMKPAVAAPTDKRGFVMSEYQAGRGVSTPSRHGCGQDEPTRKGGCMTGFMCSTSCPPYALEHAAGGFLTQPGA